MTDEMNTLLLEGTSYEMGVEQGTRYRSQIDDLYDKLTSSEYFLSSKPASISDFSFVKRAISSSSEMIQEAIRVHLPSQWDHLEGMSKGSDMSIKKLLFIQGIDALGTKLSYRREGSPVNNCSAVGVSQRQSENGGVLMVKNWDGPNSLHPHLLFRRIKHSNQDRFETLGSGIDGMAGINNGMNEKGLSVVYNYAYPQDVGKKGIPAMFLVREVLETCCTVGEAIDVLKSFPRLGGAIFMIGDGRGDLAVVESSPDRIGIRSKEDILICTNHYVEPSMKEFEVPLDAVYTDQAPEGSRGKSVHSSSYSRYEDALHELKKEKTPYSLKSLHRRIQCSHGEKDIPGEDTICNHGDKISTGFGLMIDVEDENFHAVMGKPCQKKMQ